MIVAIEPTWTGSIHAPGNAMLMNIARMAFPGQQIRVHAESRHLTEMQIVFAPSPNVRFHTIDIGKTFLHKPHIVSPGRLWREMGIIRKALAEVPASEDCLLILLSATSTAIFAADLLSRLRRGRTFVQAQLHGNLNELTGWRHGDPLRRALDLKSVLSRDYGGRLRYLVLEEFIRSKLATVSPAAAKITDVLPHPIALQGHVLPEKSLESPLHVGLVGLGSEEKGMGALLRIAARLKQELGDRVRFHHVGSAMPGIDLSKYSLLEDPPSTGQLPRSEFVARINRLHYFLFPLKENYYGLSASGALFDSIAALKPMIATRIPMTEQLFREFGNIGYLCDGENDMASIISNIARNPDHALYHAQIEALRQAQAARQPEALVPGYRDTIRNSLPGFAS
jgi:glycosyltransferase involved in cell wall biosynthesis